MVKVKNTTGRLSRFVARNPRKCLAASISVATILSAIGLIVGDFKLDADSGGWWSRGTLIADRGIQYNVLNENKGKLFKDKNGHVWEYLQKNHFQLIDEDEGAGADTRSPSTRTLKTLEETPLVSGPQEFCDMSWYGSQNNVFNRQNLYAIWKVTQDNTSALDKKVLLKICKSENNTLQTMQSKGLCGGCEKEELCLPPHSLIFALRLYTKLMHNSCEELMDAYTASMQTMFTNELMACAQETKENFDPVTKNVDNITSCPGGFLPNLVDTDFAVDGNSVIRYTSSFFYTKNTTISTKLHRAGNNFDQGDETIVRGVYDTGREDLYRVELNKSLLKDLRLAMVSLVVTFLAMLVHTKSLWLTLVGILQIIFSIPLAYFVYAIVADIRFFPFLNFIGVFVAAALGADDLFVAVDKWKNARIQNPSASSEDIAEVAFTSAAGAMLLTTSTTAVAFFATCICQVAPIRVFAIFCALMIIFNYIMNILIIFPALVLYDAWVMDMGESGNCCVACCTREVEDRVEEEVPPKEIRSSLISRILTSYYNFVHSTRWFVLSICVVAIGVCIYFAFSISLPSGSDVRLLLPSDQYELHNTWKSELLSTSLYASGAVVYVIFGLEAGDTGNKNDPGELSKLLLDDTFDPSSQEAQKYLLNFCDRLFATDFASAPNSEYQCAVNQFDFWLKDQAANTTAESYSLCNNADSLPMSEEDFHSCIIAWSQTIGNRDVLQNEGKVKTIRFASRASVRFDAGHEVMGAEWDKYEKWMQIENESAPEGVNKFFQTSPMWLWYDTNTQMISTAVGAAGITIGFSAVVILAASRSLVLTVFTGICILYVLAATTATLVAIGWDLGFIESICYAILVGLSCDFIIHFGHAYIHCPSLPSGVVPSKHDRTKCAVTHMGPSILAAAATTMSAAIVMLFCRFLFFTKYATILLVTILHATIGSFVVYIVLTDSFGPSDPTKFVDQIFRKLFGRDKDKRGGEGNDVNEDDEFIDHDVSKSKF